MFFANFNIITVKRAREPEKGDDAYEGVKPGSPVFLCGLVGPPFYDRRNRGRKEKNVYTP